MKSEFQYHYLNVACYSRMHVLNCWPCLTYLQFLHISILGHIFDNLKGGKVGGRVVKFANAIMRVVNLIKLI